MSSQSSAEDRWKKDLDDEAINLFWRCMEMKGYEMGSYLGKGRSCLVLKAWSDEDKNNVAVKVIDKMKVKSQYYEGTKLKLIINELLGHLQLLLYFHYTRETSERALGMAKDVSPEYYPPPRSHLRYQMDLLHHGILSRR